MAKYEKRQKRDEILTAAGVALFTGFLLGRQLTFALLRFMSAGWKIFKYL